MLSSLNIQNLALAESVKWNLNSGLSAITGETGAGKSVIIGALKLLSGIRADKGLIRNGEDKTTVQGVFELENHPAIDEILEETGLPACEDGQLYIRRIITPKGSKQFVNDEACTLGALKKLSDHLMDLHGPHDHQSLFANDKQLQLLDRYAQLSDTLTTYRSQWRDYLDYKAEYDAFLSSEMLSDDELELYRFQLQEITDADLNPDEVEDLEEQYQRASNFTSLNQAVGTVLSQLSDEEGVLSKLNDVLRTCRELESLDNALEPQLTPVQAAYHELEEIDHTLRSYLDKLDLDPESFQELEERINTLETLKRKYGGSVEEILQHAERIERKLNQTDEREEMQAQFEAGMQKHRDKLTKTAKKLTTARKKSAPKLAKEITEHLKDLGFRQAKFDLELVPSETLTAHGLEMVEFTFGPNPGEPSKPLKQVASSGEMSRVMLALKSSLAEHDEMPLLVFDEIDANVGGEIAAAVGQKMKALSERRQVLSITHFPQVAAIAPTHCLVEKKTIKGRTTSQMTELDGDHRVSELVRMLGASGDQAEALAKSLLAES